MPTLEQQRAAFALTKVRSIPAEAKTRAKFKTQLLKLPARLHTNGLGQTVAFYLSAGSDKPEWQICTWLEEWLRQRGVYSSGNPLVDCLAGIGNELQAEARYREASAETRALAVWLKRFAEAFLEGAVE